MNLETNLQRIKALSLKNENENWEFRTFLKFNHSPEVLDQYTHQFYQQVAAEIDCTCCGNCCKDISPALTEDDITRIAPFTNMSEAQFIQSYLTYDEMMDRVFRNKPCPFLDSTKCTCYAFRPEDCRSYPHLHKSDIMQRLGGIVANCDTCPIVFNVYEMLKNQLWSWTS